ncbi:hypothetical protein AMTR_s00022p00219430 [Amborella trichopoda]|uniref:DUF7054 domain-containing protein n=1 Tax=Amborella trichopoda TaxID=13333 RepID=W1PV39_AMBTC|nr:hypothetical protein AMTR_s00022p00219430 [Amborella trichopoda]
MAVFQRSNQVNVGKEPMGAKHLKKGVLLRSLNEVADLMLISINVHESTGHLLSCKLRFLVRVDDTVRTIIQTALRTHARHGRLPVLSKTSSSTAPILTS